MAHRLAFLELGQMGAFYAGSNRASGEVWDVTRRPTCHMVRAMTDVDADQLKDAIEKMHGGTATLAQSVPVRESFDGKPVWQGAVHVFDLAGHPTATRAYAWSSPIEGSTKRRFFAVLHTERINSPIEAVRAAIVAEHRTKQS